MRVRISVKDIRLGDRVWELMLRRAYRGEYALSLENRLDWLRGHNDLRPWVADERQRVEKEMVETHGILKSIDDEIRALGGDLDFELAQYQSDEENARRYCAWATGESNDDA